MRVITGIARGRKLETLEGEDVRPTTDRVKEAMFSIIQFELEGRRILDLFSGSGQLGIEALSRGAHCATFVDQSKESVEIIKQNLENTGLGKNTIVKNSDAIGFLTISKDVFDIAFLDPPYQQGLVQKTLPMLCDKMAPAGVIICETSLKEELPENVGEFSIYKTYKYGKIKLTVYREKEV